MNTDNVVQMPTAIDRLIAQIKIDIRRREHGDTEWTEGSYDLCLHLTELREQFPANIGFGHACDAHGLGKDVINPQTRAAATAMGRDPEALRKCLDATERRSLEWIYREEFARFTHARKTTQRKTDPAKPKAPPKKLKRALDACDQFERDGKSLSEVAVAEAAGVGTGTANKAISMRRAAETARPTAEPLDPAAVSSSTRERMEAWQRAERKRLRAIVQTEIDAEIMAAWEPLIEQVRKREKDAARILSSHKGYLSRRQYMAVVRCLHPDRAQIASPDELGEAFRLFTGLKDILLKPEEPILAGPALPKTVADLLARKRTRP